MRGRRAADDRGRELTPRRRLPRAADHVVRRTEGRAGGISNLVQIFWGKADITTDFVESGRASGDALVSGIVYVRTASGAGAPVGDTDAQVTSFEREDLARFQGENGAEPSVPRSFDLRRLRLVRICNTQFSVFEARADDDRFDLALSYLRARC
jgi:hypothetical protein